MSAIDPLIPNPVLSRCRAWPVWCALAIGLTTTLLATLYAWSEVQAINRRELGLIGLELAARVQDRFHANAQVLRDGAAFFAGSTKVTRQEWQNFVARSRLQRNLPGIQGVGFAQLIPQQRLAEHERLIRAEGFPDYRVKPEGQRPVYAPIIFIEPFTGRNLRAFGFDPLSEPVRRAAMERARDRDEAAISGKVRLVQETGQDVQVGTLMFVPVYRQGQPIATSAERRVALLGWVLSPYRMNDLIQGILRGEDLLDSRQVRLTLFDGDQTGTETLLYDSQSLPPETLEFGASSPLVARVPVEFHGHRWTLLVSRPGSLLSTLFDSRVWAVAGIGAVISILMAALWWALVESRRRAVQLSDELAARQRAEQALLDSQADLNRAQAMGQIGSWRFDARRHRIKASPEIYRLFGIPEGTQVRFETFMAAVHPDDREFVEGQWQAARTAKTYDIEHRLMVNGRVLWVRAWAEFECDEQGALLSAFGAVQDITERHESAEQLRAQLCLTQAITDCAAESIFVTDIEGHVTFMNPETERTFGWSERELRGRVLHDVIHHHYPDGRPFPYSECPNCEMRRNGEVLRNTESVYFCKDGSTRTVATSSAPLEIAGQMRGVVFVVHDITELKRAEASLRDADRRKDEFLAMLAHELRNPLAPIRNAAHILGLLDTGEPQVQWAQRIIEQQVTHLTRMVDDLLDVSRIVRGKIALKQEVVDLTELVQQVVEMTRPLIDANGHRFQLDLPPDPLWLRCDRVRLSQVLVNLIDNAVKYTPSQGRISLGARVQGEWIEVWVQDNGMGIPADLLPHVFDLFQQGERTLDRAQGGLGLGLTLVRSLVQAHGGRVRVESDGPGCGTCTRVWLPMYQGPRQAHLDRPTAEASGAPLRILVVDDEEAVADSMAILLRLDGYRVEVARNGEAAIQIAADFRPAAVLLDIGMGGMNGYEIARALRAGPGGSELFLIAVTGYGDAQAQARAREAGFDRYLVKPVGPDHLMQLLAGLKAGPGGQ